MELKQDLDYMLDIINELEKEGKSYPWAFNCTRKSYAKEYGVDIFSWAGDKGWFPKEDGEDFTTEEGKYSDNCPHLNILFPTEGRIPPSASIIAKLDISSEKPPQTEEEVKSLLFKVNKELFLPEYCGRILAWANAYHPVLENNNWFWSRILWDHIDSLVKPDDMVLRKRCGLK